MPTDCSMSSRITSVNHVKVCDVTTENAFDLIDEFYDKIKYIKDGNMLNKIKSDFIDRLPSEQEYYKEFEMVFNKCLK